MSRAFYLNLAVDNLKKNARTIIPYILTSVLTTMMLYMVVSLANNPNLNEMLGAMTLTQMLGFGVVIIEIFAFIFLFYTYSFLIKRRQKEFALFSILGMEKKHLARVLFYETWITLLVSLALGIGLGILFDKADVFNHRKNDWCRYYTWFLFLIYRYETMCSCDWIDLCIDLFLFYDSYSYFKSD